MKKRSLIVMSISLAIILVISTLFYKVDVSLDEAKNLYNSWASPKIGQCDYMDGKELILNYSFEKRKYKNIDCYVFDVKKSILKLYAFDLNETENNDVYLFQMAFVDETLLERSEVFSIGDSIEYVKQLYPNVQLIENTYVISHGDKYYFEILNSAGLYSYGLDNDGYIVSIQKFNFDTIDMDYVDFEDEWYNNITQMVQSDDSGI